MKYFSIIIFILITSCAQRIKVPINRLLSPEAIGGGAEVDFRQMGFSTGVMDFSDNSTSNPLKMSVATDNEMLLSLGVSEMVDFFVRVPKESSSILGIKVQIIGANRKAQAAGHSMAITLGMGNERDEFKSVYNLSLKSDVTDYSLIHGYRFSPMMMMYEGVSISNYHFQGSISGTTDLDSDEIDYKAENILGAHIGIIAGGTNFNLKLEYGIQKISWTNTPDKLSHSLGYSLAAGW